MNWTWDLSVLYRDFSDENIQQDFQALKTLTEETASLLHGDAKEALEKCADAFEEISRLSGKLFNFASLVLSCDAENEEAQMLMDQLMRFSVQISLLNSAYVRFLGKIENLEEIIASSEKLQKIAPKVKDKDFEDFVLKACEHYYKYLQRQRSRDRDAR